MKKNPVACPSHSQPRAARHLRVLLALALPLLLGGLLLAACGDDKPDAPAASSTPALPAEIGSAPAGPFARFFPNARNRAAAPVDDPLERYYPAVKAENRGDLALEVVRSAPRYTLDVTVDVISRTLTGSGDVLVTNNSREPWNQIVFRLYPNLEQYGGDMLVQNIALDGRPTTFTYEDENTSLRVLLPRPLLPGDRVTVRMHWSLLYPTYVDDHSVYVLFGRSQQMTSLPLFYPSLAVFTDGAAVGTGAWWRELGSIRGDAAFGPIALFAVNAVLPSDMVPVTSGTQVVTTSVSPTETQYTWVTGPAREFMLHMSPLFAQASEEAFGTRITSYWLPGEESAGRAALRYGVASLRAYSDMYGMYPLRDMHIAPAPLGFRGMEYTAAMLLGVDLYDRQRVNLEFLVAHEMAHQWWYQAVHNDPVNTPWLDEGLAEYSVKLYTEAMNGSPKADLLQYQRWEAPLETLKARGNDAAIGGAVASYKNGTQYEAVVYGKGALFFNALREDLGERAFRRFLQTYLVAHKYGIVTEDDFLAALHVLGKPELIRLYREWVGDQLLQAASVSN